MSKSDGLSDTNKDKTSIETSAIDDFDAISQALASDNSEDLGRVMSAEKDKEEDPDKDADKGTEKEDDEKEVDASDDDADKGDENTGTDDDVATPDPDKEAAPSAASTAKPDDKDLQTELHRLRSDAGRVPFLQRQLAELQRELRAQKARTPATSVKSTGDKPAPDDLSSVELPTDIQKGIDELREIDPIQANLIERVAKSAIFTANSRADHVVDTFTETERAQEQDRFIAEQTAILAQKIPQYNQIFASPEWKQWKETLTPGQLAMAQSSYANEVEQAIYAFAADMRRIHGADAAQSTTTSEAAETVKKARAEKVATSPNVKTPGAKKAVELDDDAAFQEMYNQIGKDNHIL